MKAPYRIEIYPGRRGLLQRKQWFARVVSTANGKHLFRSSEGYNNQGELVALAKTLFPGWPIVFLGDKL